MCGIAGILNLKDGPPPTAAEMTRMISPLRHRGPDQAGVYTDGRIGLGHLRLSIIGVDTGVQPICNEDGKLWIVYNGEAFNYVELKEDLLKKGHRFATETDTEVLLHLYEEYGTDCLGKINGQFALAIWDSEREELFLARDRVGIRPLYYTSSAGRLLFASEVKAILTVDGTRELDLQGLSHVFTFWTTLSGRTCFKGVHELPSGHYMVVRKGETASRCYWSVPFHDATDPARLDLDERVEELKELLTDAVRLRLRADVPVGAYLSGGLDSSIIATLISRNFNAHLKTFSMGFQEAPFDETYYQEELVRFLGADHRRVLVDNGKIRELFPDTVWHCEQPLLRTAPVPLFVLSHLVNSEGFKVVLSGEGADEVLGGYHIFKEAKVRHYWGRNPSSLRRPLLLERLYPYIFKNQPKSSSFLQRFFGARAEELDDPFFSHRVRWGNGERNLAFLSDACRAELAGYDPVAELSRALPADFYARNLLSRAQVLEMEIFLGNYLLSSQGDRVAMAHSIELRHPFLDFRVIDFCFRLPDKWKIRGLNGKYLLKRSFADQVPECVVAREKQPYRAPIRELFTPDAPHDYVDELLSEECLRKSGYFNPAKVSLLLAKHKRPQRVLSSEVENMALIGVLSTQILHRQFVEAFPASPPSIPLDKVIAVGTERRLPVHRE